MLRVVSVLAALLLFLQTAPATADAPGATIIMEPAIIRDDASASTDQSWVVLLLTLATAIAAVAR